MEGDFIRVWDGVTIASEHLNVAYTSISRICAENGQGSRKTCKGFMWRYYEDNYPLKIEPFYKAEYTHWSKTDKKMEICDKISKNYGINTGRRKASVY